MPNLLDCAGICLMTFRIPRQNAGRFSHGTDAFDETGIDVQTSSLSMPQPVPQQRLLSSSAWLQRRLPRLLQSSSASSNVPLARQAECLERQSVPSRLQQRTCASSVRDIGFGFFSTPVLGQPSTAKWAVGRHCT
eukprot:TRINITY_DN44406_c0_g1_i2.p1 TRINITY_DN44406_c0_g1~~TRINITY_DN44406_c0_g1_i2.p1  ORF type:complete len:135 (+),score=14.04 TRINITY_DN44406_c0_g1_i2:332-736(+)